MNLRFLTSMFMAGAGFMIGSQAPEFSQQYHQRLGGAVDELVVVVEQFDRDAEENGLSRRAALKQMETNEDPLIRDRGASMAKTITRSKQIKIQLKELEQASEIVRPYIALKSLDTFIAQRTVDIYRPAVPLTFSGLVYGLLGLFMFGSATWVGGAIGRLVPKRKKRPVAPAH